MQLSPLQAGGQSQVVSATVNIDHQFKYASVDEENVSDNANAYNNVSIVSALIFGFAATNLYNSIGNVPSTINFAFQLIIATVCVLSCYSMVVMSLQFYHLTRMKKKNPKQLAEFLSLTFVYRNSARMATWSSLVLFLVAMAAYVFSNNTVAAATVLAVILGSGALVIFIIWRRMSEIFNSLCKKG